MNVTIFIFFILAIIVIILAKMNSIGKKFALIYLSTTAVIINISYLNPHGLNDVSDFTYILWLVNIFLFVGTIFISGMINIKEKEEENKIDLNLEKFLKSKGFILLQLILLGILIFYKIKYNNIIEDLPTYQKRIARFSLLFDSGLENLFFNYIIVSLVNSSGIILAVSLTNKKFKYISCAIMLVNLVIYATIGYGRELLLQLFLYVAISFVIQKKVKDIFQWKNIAIICLIAVISIGAITVMTANRTRKKDMSLQEGFINAFEQQKNQVIDYFLGGFRMLDYVVNNGFGDDLPDYFYGRATLSGLEEIVLYPIKFLGAEISSFNNIITQYTQKSMPIGAQTPYFNAFYTCVMYYYIDGGIVGVAIGAVLHGMLIGYGVLLYSRKKNLQSLILLNFLFVNMIASIYKWPYQSGSTTFLTIILIILSNINVEKIMKRINIKNGKRELRREN